MKTNLICIIFSFLLISCNQEKSNLNYAQQKADNFIKNHASEFLEDKELLIYDYDPRVQFTFEQDKSNVYRVLLREKEVRLICFTDSCVLSEPFNYAKLTLSKGSYKLKQDSIIAYDSTIVKKHSFKLNPADYFVKLKKRLETYGVFACRKNESFVKVYLTTEYYLIQTEEIKKIINKDEIIKSYDNNWYFVKMETPMDLG